jgi:hypothetical protein
MADSSGSARMINGTQAAPVVKSVQLSFPMPHAPHVQIHMHLTVLRQCLQLFLATSDRAESTSSGSSMGNLVYAMPNVSYATALAHQQPSTDRERSSGSPHLRLRSVRPCMALQPRRRS